MSERSFSPAAFSFLRELAEHNTREWFADNKSRYREDVLEPALAFVNDFAPYLKVISPNFRADSRPVGGSVFRIHRDIRFSKDKTPYKTHVGIHFRHRAASDAHAPGFYVHLEPGAAFAAGGMWRPDTASQRAIREAISEDPRAWKRATGPPFSKRHSLIGESLKRPPPGFAADHPLIEDLKRKDYVGEASLKERAITSPGFLEEYAALCKESAPLLRFLCKAVDVEF